MGLVKCEYCNNFIADTDKNCPNCGAVNKYYKRTATGTPRTIEELKRWYQDHHLPPEETTRFFIGKNIKSPKAFGIYKDGKNFVVYKNKADGSRAIRYSGTDEAYAVNEIYLKLKSEILNQKNANQQKRSQGSSTRRNGSSRTASGSYSGSTSADSIKRLFSNGLITGGVLGLLLALIIYGMTGCDQVSEVSTYSYYQDQQEALYYFVWSHAAPEEDACYNWWKYDEDEGDWSVYLHNVPNRDFPEELLITGSNGKKKSPDTTNLSDYAARKGKNYEDYSIYRSKNYQDAGNHRQPSTQYYYCEDKLYYYLNDYYGSSYGSGDNSGWYLYDDDQDEWSYLCSYDDRDSLSDALWYLADDYYVGQTLTDAYDYVGEEVGSWSNANFDDTIWGEEYNAAYNAYWEDHKTSSSNNSSSDDDDDDWSWDWDSGDSWDSDFTDWDSDW